MGETNELIRRYQKGDVKAFEFVFLKYEGLVFRNAMLMTNNRQQAEDVLQDVFVSVWNTRHSYNPKKAGFTTWLYKITMNRCIDNFRKEQPYRFSEKEAPDLTMEDNGLPEEEFINKLEYERLLRLINHLDERHRPAIILRYFDGLSYKEIAEVLDIPLGTVKSRIHNALRLLRERMSPIALENNTEERGGGHEL